MAAREPSRQQLQAFFTKYKAPAPVYSFQQSTLGWECACQTTAVQTPQGEVPAAKYVGQGQSKKAAQAATATLALEGLKNHSAFTDKVSTSLWETVKLVVSDQVS